MKTGIIDVGGGMRGVYAAGVFEYLMEHEIRFDVCIGVSAGSANLSTYLAGQKNRNIVYYSNYSMRREYMGLWNFIKSGSYVNLPYIYGTLTNSDGENPLHYEGLKENPSQFFVVTTEAMTGNVKYFEKKDIHKDDYRVLMASANLPAVNRPFPIDGTDYFDGALADPVPLEKAFSEGCDKVVLILTKPCDKPRTSKNDERFARLIAKKYPQAAEKLRSRAARYNECVEMAKAYAKEGKVCIISPKDTFGVDTLTRNKTNMMRLYEEGKKDGTKIKAFLSK